MTEVIALEGRHRLRKLPEIARTAVSLCKQLFSSTKQAIAPFSTHGTHFFRDKLLGFAVGSRLQQDITGLSSVCALVTAAYIDNRL